MNVSIVLQLELMLLRYVAGKRTTVHVVVVVGVGVVVGRCFKRHKIYGVGLFFQVDFSAVPNFAL